MVVLKTRFRNITVSLAGVAVFAMVATAAVPRVVTETRPISKVIPNHSNSSVSNVVPVYSPKTALKKVEPAPKNKLPKDFLQLKDKYKLSTIPTYDGSYQLTHPKVLYYEKGWNGYKYWMSMTPYPHGHDVYENPSILVSNDGNNWAAPEGLKNPVSGVPADLKAGGHYSDPQLVMKGETMELWYRYNPSLPNKGNKRLPNNAVNIYYRKTTTDGIHWTPAQKLLQSRDGHLSLCVNYEDNLYKTWYATYGGDLMYSESKDALNWSAPVLCKVPLPKGLVPYHQDLIKNGSEYYLLQTAQKRANYTFQLFLLTSKDGIHFGDPQPIYPNKDTAMWKDISFYRSTLFVKDNKLELYISMIIPRQKWFMTQITLPLPKPIQDQEQKPEQNTVPQPVQEPAVQNLIAV